MDFRGKPRTLETKINAFVAWSLAEARSGNKNFSRYKGNDTGWGVLLFLQAC